jgi:hypothetical protein
MIPPLIMFISARVLKIKLYRRLPPTNTDTNNATVPLCFVSLSFSQMTQGKLSLMLIEASQTSSPSPWYVCIASHY